MSLWLKSYKSSWKLVQFLVKFHLLHRYFPGHFLKSVKSSQALKLEFWHCENEMHELKNTCMNKFLQENSHISILPLLNRKFKKLEAKIYH